MIKTFYETKRGGRVMPMESTMNKIPRNAHAYGREYYTYFDECGYPCKPQEAYTRIAYQDMIVSDTKPVTEYPKPDFSDED